MAIAKNTRLLTGNYKRLNIAALKAKPPYLIYIGKPLEAYARNFKSFGKTFIARFSREGFDFRLDADAELSLSRILANVGTLLSSETLMQGYPETLRVAHILSMLTPIEVLAIERFLAENYGVKVRKPRSIRRMIFGPYSGREETQT
jgi:hypothetical protein